MARPPLPIGERGAIKRTQLQDGTWQALCRYRDTDGVTRRVKAYGPSGQKAENNLKRKLKDRHHSTEDINPETRVEVLAERWYATVDRAPGTLEAYRHALDRHIIPRLGKQRIREATTARLDAFIEATGKQSTTTQTNPRTGHVSVIKHGGPTAAKQARTVLSLMFGMAARYDAVPTNPVRDTILNQPKSKPVKAMTAEQFQQFWEHVQEWAKGGTYGPKRNQSVLDVVELFIATGLRPGELLGLQFRDVDGDRIAVTGTIKRTKTKGLHRQDYPKSEHGDRTLLLPTFAHDVIRRRQKAQPDKGGLIFTNRNGDPWEPANFSRLWVQVRGKEWEWVQPRSFRPAVATAIEREAGSIVASRQLGHSSDAVTRRHYIKPEHAAPDSRHILERLRGTNKGTLSDGGLSTFTQENMQGDRNSPSNEPQQPRKQAGNND